MPPKRSGLKPYLRGVFPLKCPTSSLGHSSRLSPNSRHYLQSSPSSLNRVGVLLVGEDQMLASAAELRRGWLGKGGRPWPTALALRQQPWAGPRAPSGEPGTEEP